MAVKVKLLRLEHEITAFENKPIEKGKILFYGDSGFTRWKAKDGIIPLEEAIPETMNHGFGSATAEEMLYYYPRAVKPFAPKILVWKTFGNDVIHGYTPEECLFLSERLFEYARNDFPNIHFLLIAPFFHYGRYPKNPGYHADRLAFDQMLKDYASVHKDTFYASVMDDPEFTGDCTQTGPEARIKRDLFGEDGIHFNKQGYDLFASFCMEKLDAIRQNRK